MYSPLPTTSLYDGGWIGSPGLTSEGEAGAEGLASVLLIPDRRRSPGPEARALLSGSIPSPDVLKLVLLAFFIAIHRNRSIKIINMMPRRTNMTIRMIIGMLRKALSLLIEEFTRQYSSCSSLGSPSQLTNPSQKSSLLMHFSLPGHCL